jgi:hypothetical protein
VAAMAYDYDALPQYTRVEDVAAEAEVEGI